MMDHFAGAVRLDARLRDRLSTVGAPRGPDPELVERLRAALGGGPPVRLAVLFGSAASGRQRPDSDVDVAVLAPIAGLDESLERSLHRALTRGARSDVDLVRIERASTLLTWQIALRGVLLAEASPGEFARFRARAASDYIDYAPSLAHHGEIFRRRLIEERGRR